MFFFEKKEPKNFCAFSAALHCANLGEERVGKLSKIGFILGSERTYELDGVIASLHEQ